jgi:hypothetical protein
MNFTVVQKSRLALGNLALGNLAKCYHSKIEVFDEK